MSTSAGTITGTFGWSNTPLAQGMREAEQMAKTTGNKIAATLNDVPRKVNWSRVSAQNQQFLAPIRRARTAADFAPAPAGKYASPEEQGEIGQRRNILSSITRGLGAIGLAHIVVRILKDMGDAQAKADELASSITKITSGSFNGGSFRAIGEIDNEITNLKDKLEELRAADRPQTTSGALKQLFESGNVAGGLKEVHRLSTEQQGKIQSAITRDLTAQVEKQQALTALGAEALNGSEEQVAIQKQMLAFKERMGAIDEKYQDLPGAGDARNKLQAEAAAQNLTALQAIKERMALRRKELEMESAIGGIEASDLTAPQKQLAILNAHRNQLNDRFQHGTEESKVATGIEMGKNSLELRDLRLAQFQKPFAQRQAELLQQKDRDRELKRFNDNGGLLDVHRDMSGNVLDGIDPFTNQRVKPGANGGDDTQNVTTGDAVSVLNDIKTGIDELIQQWQ